jgi:preprotein translocase subunit SecY
MNQLETNSFFKNKELIERLSITLLVIFICRFLVSIPVPCVDKMGLENQDLGMFEMFNLFSGGAFKRMSIVALGVMPYITASIILQLFSTLLPSMKREMKENPHGAKKKLGNYTRILTLVIGTSTAITYATWVLNYARTAIVDEILQFTMYNVPILYYLIFVLSMSTGTLILMWLGEKISDEGVGNGISLIIAIGILASYPLQISQIFASMNLTGIEAGELSITNVVLLFIIFASILSASISLTLSLRKVPVQYARRLSQNTRSPGGMQTSYLPLKVNTAGVIPVIMSSQILAFLSAIVGFTEGTSFNSILKPYLVPESFIYIIVMGLLTILFAYFWISVQFKAGDIATNLKRNGGFIPGIRQGKSTEVYLLKIMKHLTFIGANILALIAVAPNLSAIFLSVNVYTVSFAGGTSLLILVGVIIDTINQIQSYTLNEKYRGLISGL